MNNSKNFAVNLDDCNAELLKRNLKHFVREFWDEVNNQSLEWNWHLDVLCEEYMAISKRVRDKEPKLGDYVINVPPGTSKTKILSVLATCWDFANDPSTKEFVGSYSDSAVMSIGYDIRQIMRSEKFLKYFPDVQVAKDFDTKHEFRTTQGGHFFAFTVGGTLTSKHADILKVDDPLNPNEVNSEAEINKTNKFFDRTLPTRKTNKAITPTILIMQRLDEKDPSGHLLSKPRKKIIHICLPGELSENVKPAHLMDRYEGGLLDANRLNLDVLDDLKVDLGSDGYSAQIMQDPAPAGGSIWQRWFIEIEDKLWPRKSLFTQYGYDWDTAQTKDEKKNAASAYIGGGRIGNDIYIDDFDFRWLEFPELVKWMMSLDGTHFIENKSSGRDLRSTLVRYGLNAMLVSVPGDKIARAKMATPPAEAGRVYIRKSLANRIYTDDRQGILKFPNGKFKDLADALSQFIMRLNKKATNVVSSNTHDDILEDLFSNNG